MIEKLPSTFRILHTADWHLGKTLADQSRDQEHQLFLTWLLDQIRDHQVDWLILSGDVFDSANPPTLAQNRYYSFVADLFRLGTCGMSIISGNHDSQSHLEAPRELLAQLGVRVAGALDPQVANRIQLIPSEQNPRAIVALIPFLRDRDVRQGRAGESGEEIQQALIGGITHCYQETLEAIQDLEAYGPGRSQESLLGVQGPGVEPVVVEPLIVKPLIVGLGHLTVAGSAKSESERDIHIGGLGALSPDNFPPGYDYIALGHLHRPQWAGSDQRIRYSGSPIPLSFSEIGDKKSVTIIDVPGFPEAEVGPRATTEAPSKKDQPDASPKQQTFRCWELLVPEFRRLVRVGLGSDQEVATTQELVTYLDELQSAGSSAAGAGTDVAGAGARAGGIGGTSGANPAPELATELGLWAEVRVSKASQFQVQQLMAELTDIGKDKPWFILKVVRDGAWDSGDLADHWQGDPDGKVRVLDDPYQVFQILLDSRKDQLDQVPELRGQVEREFQLLYEALDVSSGRG